MSESEKLEVVSTEDSAGAIGPFSQGIRVGNLVYTAGQIGMDPKTMELVGTDIESQAHRAMKNLRGVIKAAGSTMQQVIKCTVYLDDFKDFNRFNKVYAEYFGEHRPGRTCFQVSRLPKDAKVEVEAIAWANTRPSKL